MNRIRYLFPKLLLSLVIVVILGACGTQPNHDDLSTDSMSKVGVGIVLPTQDEERWRQDAIYFEEELTKAGYNVDVKFSQADPSKEKANVETLITYGTKILIVCPVNGIAAAAAAETAHGGGAKVIAFEKLILNTDAVDYYVSSDNLAAGAAQAQYLVDHAQGQGNPLYLYAGVSTDIAAQTSFVGAWSVLRPKIADGTFAVANSSKAVSFQNKATLTFDEVRQIIWQITTNEDPEIATRLAEINLEMAGAENKGDVYILTSSDITTRAIADVFAADTDIRRAFIAGQGTEEASLRRIIDGKQGMTVLKDDLRLIKETVAIIKALLTGRPLEKTASYHNGKIDVPARLSPIVALTKDNFIAILCDGYHPSACCLWDDSCTAQ